MRTKARLIAFYLPQFHPISENDNWWGKGFTEWTNVGKAKPLFWHHEQPKVPSELGYYDLRVPETRCAQAELAKQHGIEGFCYWHYWFGNGVRLLERPFQEVLESKSPDFPFCLAWANESWKGFAHGLTNRNTLQEQLYPGEVDYIAHFKEVLPAFLDSRYMRIDDKPIFMIYKPFQHPEMVQFMTLWQTLAKQNGLKGIHFIAQVYKDKEFQPALKLGFDSVNIVRMYDYKRNKSYRLTKTVANLKSRLLNQSKVYQYRDVSRFFTCKKDQEAQLHPTIIPNWDHTPRSGKEGIVFQKSTPKHFRAHVKTVLENIKYKPEGHQIAFIKSWNEWAEGNYLEPDLKDGRAYLEVIADELTSILDTKNLLE